VPNGEILRVGNMSQQWSVAVVDTVVGPTADVDVASTLIEETAARVTARDDLQADVLEPPQLLGVESIRPEGTTLRLLVKTHPGRQAILARALREEIQRALVKAGIPLPAPYLAPQYGEPPVP
jgi:small conductance mechanosensitive channel